MQQGKLCIVLSFKYTHLLNCHYHYKQELLKATRREFKFFCNVGL